MFNFGATIKLDVYTADVRCTRIIIYIYFIYILCYPQVDRDRWSMVKQLGQVTRDEYLNHLPMHI